MDGMCKLNVSFPERRNPRLVRGEGSEGRDSGEVRERCLRSGNAQANYNTRFAYRNNPFNRFYLSRFGGVSTTLTVISDVLPCGADSARHEYRLTALETGAKTSYADTLHVVRHPAGCLSRANGLSRDLDSSQVVAREYNGRIRSVAGVPKV